MTISMKCISVRQYFTAYGIKYRVDLSNEESNSLEG